MLNFLKVNLLSLYFFKKKNNSIFFFNNKANIKNINLFFFNNKKKIFFINKIYFNYIFRKNLKYYYIFKFNNNPAFSFSSNYKINSYLKKKIINNNEKLFLLISFRYLLYLFFFIKKEINRYSLTILFNKINFIFFNNLSFFIKCLNMCKNLNFNFIINNIKWNQKVYYKKIKSINKNTKKKLLNKIKLNKININK